MAIAKAERLMNLALCLLGTRRPLSKRELRGSIEAYLEAGNDDSFNRMFERDKDDLRELGLVIETVDNIDGEVGYHARRDSNRLPPLTLDAEEAAALGLAAKVWQQAWLAGCRQRRAPQAARGRAPRRRRPLRRELRPRTAHPGPRVRLRTADAGLPRPPPGRLRLPQGQRGAARPRQVEPWALECWRGHWYLAYFDRDRGAERVFRLSRITGKVRTRSGGFTADVPDVVTVRETVAGWAGESAEGTAVIRLRSGAGYPLRAKARSVTPLGEGWDELEIPYGHGLDASLVEYGPDVVVQEPAELRADVIDRLRAVAKD